MNEILRPTRAKLLLASNSPRRRELLSMIDPDYAVAIMHDIDETYPADLPHDQVPAYLSKLKAKAYKSQLQPDEIIITADTVVILDNQILGKPHSADEAVEMLCSLMGRTHTVITGVTLTSLDHTDTFSEATEVTFAHISREEIAAYVADYKPMDKAGAYGIQEWVGAVAIQGIKGCFYNVMGLPVHTLFQHLRKFPV